MREPQHFSLRPSPQLVFQFMPGKACLDSRPGHRSLNRLPVGHLALLPGASCSCTCFNVSTAVTQTGSMTLEPCYFLWCFSPDLVGCTQAASRTKAFFTPLFLKGFHQQMQNTIEKIE
ncbi:Hypothetical predicted protein [Marmota monax]|uniref:Uncharacterized protein n=1 Tax=Marmota monax TaxID=9995 RepID=A0A5E4BPB0_MARMO|nr:hypothetical protein GHT09_009086 [Marmota monax]VTJ71493.1 Hypothetical predicted protein [Marmota monax]